MYCASCGGAIMGSSTQPAGMHDEVAFRHEDYSYVNDDQTVYIEVRYVSATTCAAPWTVTVSGHTSVASTTCSP